MAGWPLSTSPQQQLTVFFDWPPPSLWGRMPFLTSATSSSCMQESKLLWASGLPDDCAIADMNDNGINQLVTSSAGLNCSGAPSF